MEYKYFLCNKMCTIKDKENNSIDCDFIIFLDNETLGCHLEELNHINFSKRNVIVDCLFHTGCQDNRFALFDIDKQKNKRFLSASKIILSEELINKINDMLSLFADKFCKEYLNFSDKKLFSNRIEYNVSVNLKNDESYIVNFKDYPIIGLGKTKK